MSDQTDIFPTPMVYHLDHLITTLDDFLGRVIEYVGEDALTVEAQRIRDLIPPSPAQSLMVELPEPTEATKKSATWRTQDTWVTAQYLKDSVSEIWVNNIRGAVRDTRGLALALLAATDRMS